jgi:hypothetical protein
MSGIAAGPDRQARERGGSGARAGASAESASARAGEAAARASGRRTPTRALEGERCAGEAARARPLLPSLPRLAAGGTHPDVWPSHARVSGCARSIYGASARQSCPWRVRRCSSDQISARRCQQRVCQHQMRQRRRLLYRHFAADLRHVVQARARAGQPAPEATARSVVPDHTTHVIPRALSSSAMRRALQLAGGALRGGASTRPALPSVCRGFADAASEAAPAAAPPAVDDDKSPAGASCLRCHAQPSCAMR